MTDEQINKAIAEHCGWTEIRRADFCNLIGINPNGPKGPTADCVPCFASDLNAIVSAPIGFSNMGQYGEELRIAAGCVGSRGGHFTPNAFGVLAIANLTARQRAEAFLRAVGKWEDGQ